MPTSRCDENSHFESDYGLHTHVDFSPTGSVQFDVGFSHVDPFHIYRTSYSDQDTAFALPPELTATIRFLNGEEAYELSNIGRWNRDFNS